MSAIIFLGTLHYPFEHAVIISVKMLFMFSYLLKIANGTVAERHDSLISYLKFLNTNEEFKIKDGKIF
jgi:hypothetical protein